MKSKVDKIVKSAVSGGKSAPVKSVKVKVKFDNPKKK